MIHDVTGSSILVTSIKKHGILILIVLLGAAIRLWFAQADPFLHDWDERFHALVARNMMDDPFIPVLKPLTLLSPSDDPNVWCCNHIWLHKQPLFMWQMAVSMKLFGVSEFSMRLPSVIMGSLMILLLYRITLLVTANVTTALIAACLLSFSHFHLILIAGIKGMDHNDVAFGFYVLASFWAFAEYTKSGKWTWVILTGLCAGCAILNKWLTGLTVFLAWGISLLYDLRDKKPKELLRFATALLVCCLVFLPWQFYIFHAFPQQAAFESAYNIRHLFEAVEGHQGGIWFYYDNFPKYFGNYIWIGIFPGILLAFFRKSVDKRLLLAFLVCLLAVFSFFSFIAQTKVDAYFFVAAPLCMLFMAVCFQGIYSLFHRKYMLVLFLCLLPCFSLHPAEIKTYFSPDNRERNRKIHNTSIYKNLKKHLPENINIVMGLNGYEDVELMFYNKNIAATHWWIGEAQLQELASRQVPIATFKSHNEYMAPTHILEYKQLHIIDEEIK